MAKKTTITGHCIVKNEDRFIWFAINSVLPYLDRLLIYDTGSTDKTVEIVKSIKSKKIFFEEMGPVTPEKLTFLRGEQIKKTDTDFFFILDGDEIWPEKSIKKFISSLITLPQDKLAVFCKTRNAVGDVFHYLPEDAGRYKLAGRSGHLNIRAYRNISGWTVIRTYPLEVYVYNKKAINDQPDKLQFLDVWYLHCTHLSRSTIGHNPKFKYELGIPMRNDELPKVFSKSPDRRSKFYFLRSLVETPLRRIRRKILQ